MKLIELTFLLLSAVSFAGLGRFAGRGLLLGHVDYGLMF